MEWWKFRWPIDTGFCISSSTITDDGSLCDSLWTSVGLCLWWPAHPSTVHINPPCQQLILTAKGLLIDGDLNVMQSAPYWSVVYRLLVHSKLQIRVVLSFYLYLLKSAVSAKLLWRFVSFGWETIITDSLSRQPGCSSRWISTNKDRGRHHGEDQLNNALCWKLQTMTSTTPSQLYWVSRLLLFSSCQPSKYSNPWSN